MINRPLINRRARRLQIRFRPSILATAGRAIAIWETSFTVSITLNELADDDNGGGLTFPVDITSVTVEAKQASGGIVTPRTGAEVEHSDYVITQSSGSRFNAVGNTITMTIFAWYDLPNLRKEAFINVGLSMLDSDSQTVSKAVKARVAP